MTKTFPTWTVLPHAPIEKLEEDLWRIEGDLPGMSLRRQMILVRRADKSITVHNAMALHDEAMREIEAWGTVTAIVVPGGWHRLNCLNYKHRYPEAKVFCPAGARRNVEQVVRVDGTYDDFANDPALQLEHLQGLKLAEGVMRVRTTAGLTLVFNDLLFNVPTLPGFEGFIMRLIGSTGGPRIPRVARLLMVKDKRALREHLEGLASDAHLVRIVFGHGIPVLGGAGELLKGLASTL